MEERSRIPPRAAEAARHRERQRALLAAVDDPSVTPIGLRICLIRTVELLGADAGSVFLFDEAGGLRGAYGIWDWMRTSFLARLDDWPSVRDALDSALPLLLTKQRAREVESDWFGAHGIELSLVVPLVGETGPVGVLFIDFYSDQYQLTPDDSAFLSALARTWAHAVERGPTSVSRPAISADELVAADTPVAQVMSRAPVMVDDRIPVHVALRLSLAAGVHHLVAVRDGLLAGVVAQRDLESARPNACLEDLLSSDVVRVTPDTKASVAAEVMLDRALGCLPVTNADGNVLGVVTRRDLRRAGVLRGERGVDVCAACGSSHGLPPRLDPEVPIFCEACVGAPMSAASVDALYCTLGGVD